MTFDSSALPWHKLPQALLRLPWFVFAFMLMTLVMVLSFSSLLPEPDDRWRLADPEISPNAIIESAAELRHVELPHDWFIDDMRANEYWYRFTFNPHDEVSLALLAFNAQQEARIWLNGKHLPLPAADGNVTGSRLWNTPLFTFIPDSLLIRDEENELIIKITSRPARFGLLGKVYIGPGYEIEPSWSWRSAHRKTSLIIVTTGLMFLSLFVFAIGIVRKQEHMYLYFAASCLIWVIHNIPHITAPPSWLSPQLWDILSYVSLGWMVIFIVIYDHRHAGYCNPVFERRCIQFGLFAPLPMFIMPLDMMHTYAIYFWYLFIVSLGGYALAFLAIRNYQQAQRELQLVFMGGIAIFGAGAHDYLIITGMLPKTDGFFIQYSGLPAMSIFSWFILKRFLRTLRDYEALTNELEDRIQHKEHQLRSSYEERKELERQQLLAEERERIMQDMHDGVGGQLVTTLLKIEQVSDVSEIREDVKDCLTDLRLVIDSLDPSADELPVLLAMVRTRLTDKLSIAGIELVWQANSMDTPADFGPRKCLHVMRIVQEAITNAIKHSQCTQIIFQSNTVDGYIEIVVNDNGSWQEHSSTLGKGMMSMQNRAAQINSDLTVSPAEQGTKVMLRIPLI